MASHLTFSSSTIVFIFLYTSASCWIGLNSTRNPTCQIKEDCNLNEKLIAIEPTNKNSDNLENKIASIFDDKVNYSLKLTYIDEAIVNYNPIGNFTTHVNEENLIRSSFAGIDNGSQSSEIDDEEDYIRAIGSKFISLAQPFDASRNPKSSNACREHTRIFLDSLHHFDLWALQMHDSTGRFSSGVLNGNINQPGDFDQCMGIEHRLDGSSSDTTLQGQYCLAYAQPNISKFKSKRLRDFFDLAQSHSPFSSEFNDPGHRVPRYSLINWGICVPSSCSPQDVEYSVKEYLDNMTQSTGMGFQVRVEPRMCQVKENIAWDRSTTWAVRFFLCILSVVILSTVYEMQTKGMKSNEWFTAFSLDKNLKWLFSTNSSRDDIAAVHGIRFLNAIMLLLSHKSMAVFFNPYNNRTEMAESLGKSWTVIGRAASLYTDPFLLFSGMLTAYSLFGRLLKGQPLKLRNEYIGRLMRIVPPLAALILFCTYVLPMWSSGPQWNLVIGHHSDICKKNWWRNLLFIHNYFGFSEMCLTHTHHLGIDTELFAVAPLMIFGLWKWPRKGLMTLLVLAAAGTGARYYTTVANQLSNYVYFGTTIQRLFRTADFMYSFPPYRSTVYILGILLGYALRKFHNSKLTKLELRLGWTAAIGCFLCSLFGPAPMGDVSYLYNSTHAAIYAAFAPIAWCFCFGWIVFSSHLGYKNAVTNLLSWKGFQVFTKLSYAVYLTQFPVFFFNVGRRRHVHHYYNFISMIIDTNEFICIFISSIVLTLLFDAPFQNIKKIIFRRLPSNTGRADSPLLSSSSCSNGILVSQSKRSENILIVQNKSHNE